MRIVSPDTQSCVSVCVSVPSVCKCVMVLRRLTIACASARVCMNYVPFVCPSTSASVSVCFCAGSTKRNRESRL